VTSKLKKKIEKEFILIRYRALIDDHTLKC